MRPPPPDLRGNPSPRVALPALTLLLLLLEACSDAPQNPPDAGSGLCGAGQPPSTASRSLTGLLTYDRVPVGPTGLDYASTLRKPIRGARVEVSSAGAPLATTNSDATGHYALTWTGPAVATLRIFAATDAPVISVEDHTSSFTLYELDSCVDSGASGTADVHAPSGWGGDHYSAPRLSAPFAILDTVLGASQAFLAERPVAFPPVHVGWSPRHNPGQHYVASEQRIYLNGRENVDTDEFDQQVILHEWGHHLVIQLGRADDGAGPNVNYHGPGFIQDPRVCWNEGFATAIAAIVLYPDIVNVNTAGPMQGDRVYPFNAERDDVNGPLFDRNSGWFEEGSVVHIIYDLFDPPSSDEPFDTLSLSLGEIYDVLVGPSRETDAFATIFSFLHALKSARPELAAQVDAISERYRVGPVQDEWGTGEANDGGLDGLLPVYVLLVRDGPAAELLPALDLADLGNDPARFARFVGDGSVVDLVADAGGAAVFLKLFRKGALLAAGTQTPQGSVAVKQFTTTAGAVYTVGVAPPPGGGSFPTQLQLLTH